MNNKFTLERMNIGEYAQMSANLGAASTKIERGKDGKLIIYLEAGKAMLDDKERTIEMEGPGLPSLYKMRKESGIVKIVASSEELKIFLKEFSNGRGFSAERNGKRYLVHTLDEIRKTAEIKVAFTEDKEALALQELIECYFGAPREDYTEQ